MVRIELFEHIRFELAVLADRLDDLFSFLVRSRFDEVGDLCRSEPGELAVRDPHPRGRDVRDERLDALPVDDLAQPDPPGEKAWQRASDRSPRRGVDTDHVPRPVDLGELDLVRPDEASTDDIDDVAPGEVALEQQLARTTLEATEVQGLALELDPSRSHLEERVDRDEQLPAADVRDQPGDEGVVTGRGEHDQVVDVRPILIAAAIDERTPDERREMDDIRRHQPDAFDARQPGFGTSSS